MRWYNTLSSFRLHLLKSPDLRMSSFPDAHSSWISHLWRNFWARWSKRSSLSSKKSMTFLKKISEHYIKNGLFQQKQADVGYSRPCQATFLLVDFTKIWMTQLVNKPHFFLLQSPISLILCLQFSILALLSSSNECSMPFLTPQCWFKKKKKLSWMPYICLQCGRKFPIWYLFGEARYLY